LSGWSGLPTGNRYSSKIIAHKKGRCKRSGQGKTLDQELQINVSEHGAINRIFDSSEIFHHGASRHIVPYDGLL